MGKVSKKEKARVLWWPDSHFERIKVEKRTWKGKMAFSAEGWSMNKNEKTAGRPGHSVIAPLINGLVYKRTSAAD